MKPEEFAEPTPEPIFFKIEELQQQTTADIEAEIKGWAFYSLLAKVAGGLGAIAAPMQLIMNESPGKALTGAVVAGAGYLSGKYIDRDNGIRQDELAKRQNPPARRRSGRHKKS